MGIGSSKKFDRHFALDELDVFFLLNQYQFCMDSFFSDSARFHVDVQPFRVAFVARAKTMREDRFKRLVDAVCDHGGARKRRKHFANGRVIFQVCQCYSVLQSIVSEPLQPPSILKIVGHDT